MRAHRGTGPADSGRLPSEADCKAIAQRVFDLARGGGETRVFIAGWWNGELRWARNRVSLAGDRRDVDVRVTRFTSAGKGDARTNQLDDASLEATVRAAEREAAVFELFQYVKAGGLPPLPGTDLRQPVIWSDATYDLTTEARGDLVRSLIAPAEGKGMLSAGYLEMHAGAKALISSWRSSGPFTPWDEPYVAWTQARCSLTVRDPSGTASGWAGLSSYDWGRLDAPALAARALEKCEASRHPVAIEPGRYTVVLEPQAVADLMEPVVDSMLRDVAGTPWALGEDDALHMLRYKLGLKVVDSRLTLDHDPMDPRLGILNQPGSAMGPVTWIDHGVLTNLQYTREAAVPELNANLGMRGPDVAYRLSGGHTSVEDMIQRTRRGLLVTRFDDVTAIDGRTLLSHGLTRDGLWLIEDGKITHAVKNFRFTESPLFVLNSLDEIGESVPVFRPAWDGLTPAIVPALKAHDFSFTSLIDAI